MNLKNTTIEEDEILSEAEHEGGIAAQVAQIADRLDAELTERTKELEEATVEALTNLENDDGAIAPSAGEMVQTAITDAGGTPKGPPETDIRAENAALRQSLAWALFKIRQASHYGDNTGSKLCWEAYESNRGHAARLLVKAVTVTDAPDHAADLATALIEQPLLERIAALRASLAWAINTFQGESGLGDNYWEQFPEYLAACALVADANPQPKEEAP